MSVFSYIALAGLILLCTFFSLSEISYAHVNSLRLRKRAEKSTRATLKTALYISEHYEQALTATLLGNNLANIGATSLATVIVLMLLGEQYTWVSSVAMTVIILIIGEITPKQLAARIPEKVCTFVAIPLRLIMMLFFPFVWLINQLNILLGKLYKDKIPQTPTVTETELESILETVEDEGVIDEEMGDLLQSALDFDEVLAYEVLTPRVDMDAIDIDDDFEQILDQAFAATYSRLPVYQDTTDNIIGILHLNHLFKALVENDRPDVRALLIPVQYVHKTMPLPDALKIMRRHKCHMVVVNDEYGGTMGILTMEDILEQLVGDIWDESDEIEEEFLLLSPDTATVDGDMRIYDFFDEVDCDDRDYDDDNATVGGWAMDMLGGYPRVGDSFDYKNLTLTVTAINGRRVEQLQVKIHPLPEEDAD